MSRFGSADRTDFSHAQPFKIDGVYCKLIQLTQGHYAIVNAEDYAWLSLWKWHVRWNETSRKFYAQRPRLAGDIGTPRYIKMHNVIGKNDPPLITDHANRNSLDNRRSNLRPATKTQNNANCAPRSGRKYKGTQIFPGNRWQAKICVNRKQIHLGFYGSEEEAARRYDVAAREHFGEFASLNFPDTR